MLVLKRLVNESILIGENIRVVVIAAGSGRDPEHQWVKLGIEAPRDVQVDRPDAKNHNARKRAQMFAI